MTPPQESFVAIFDADKTLLPDYSIIDFAKFLSQRNHFRKSTWNLFEILLLQYKNKRIEYNAFADEVVRLYGEGIQGQSLQTIEGLSTLFWQDRVMTIYPFVPLLFRSLRDISAVCILLSGSTQESLQGLLSLFRFDETFTTLIEKLGKSYSSRVAVNAASETEKCKAVQTIFDKYPNAVTFGFGDSVADLAFLNRVQYPVVVGSHDPTLQQRVIEKGWPNIIDPVHTYAFSVVQLLAKKNL